MRPRGQYHLALLLAALVLPYVIACGRPEQRPVEPHPQAIAEADGPKSRGPALPRRDLIRSTPPGEIRITAFPLRGVDGEMVYFRPVTTKSIAWQLDRLEPVTVRGETAYFRIGAWIRSTRAIGSKYTTAKWQHEALVLLVPSQEEGIWLELTITLASGGSVSKARLIETAESSPYFQFEG